MSTQPPHLSQTFTLTLQLEPTSLLVWKLTRRAPSSWPVIGTEPEATALIVSESPSGVTDRIAPAKVGVLDERTGEAVAVTLRRSVGAVRRTRRAGRSAGAAGRNRAGMSSDARDGAGTARP